MDVRSAGTFTKRLYGSKDVSMMLPVLDILTGIVIIIGAMGFFISLAVHIDRERKAKNEEAKDSNESRTYLYVSIGGLFVFLVIGALVLTKGSISAYYINNKNKENRENVENHKTSMNEYRAALDEVSQHFGTRQRSGTSQHLHSRHKFDPFMSHYSSDHTETNS